MQEMEEEFQFLLCEKCHGINKNPKLLSCLHTLCTECLDEYKPIGHCPVCNMSLRGVSFQDNTLFSNLQEKLNIHQKITNDGALPCDRCKDGAEFWCSECDNFLCRKCYDFHQWFLKEKSHEAQSLTDLKNCSAREFLDGARRSRNSHFYCPNSTHYNEAQVTSIYCRGCQKPLCCSCALLDNQHSTLYCDIHVEIDDRKKELETMSKELVERKSRCENTYSAIHHQMQQMEKVRNETRERIHQKVDEMIQFIRQKGEELLGEVDQQLHQDHQYCDEKLQRVDCMVKRMTSSERLVEKMNLFASDQEVMDMHPFIRGSLEELKKETLPAIGVQFKKNFTGVQEKLQALYRRVISHRDAAGSVASTSTFGSSTASTTSTTSTACTSTASVVNWDVPQDGTNQSMFQGKQTQVPMHSLSVGGTSHGLVPSVISPLKRPVNQVTKAVQSSNKMMKCEDSDDGEPSTSHPQDAATDSHHVPLESTPENEERGTVTLVEDLENSPVEINESENTSIVISSSEDTDEDTMVCGNSIMPVTFEMSLD